MARLNGENEAGGMDAAALALEARLDLLVDDELGETERRGVLEAMDAAPGEWRRLAVRFLERQAERKAVRQLIAGVGLSRGGEIAASYPFTAKKKSLWAGARNVAAVLAVAGLAGLGGLEAGRSSGPASKGGEAVASSMVAPVPGNILGGQGAGNVNVEVPLVGEREVSANYPFVQPGQVEGHGARHVVITPWGDHRAVAFPVTTVEAAEFR